MGAKSGNRIRMKTHPKERNRRIIVSGLLNKAGVPSNQRSKIDPANDWETSMVAQIESIRAAIRERDPKGVALSSGAKFNDGEISLSYWETQVRVAWPGLNMITAAGDPLSTFDTAMLTYYLHTADDAAMGDRWIGFRELPDGAFYNQAFQGYTGNRLATGFGDDPDLFVQCAVKLKGMRLTGLANDAYAFLPLPRIRIAAVLWPGDEEMPSKASVLFDSAAAHYLPTDGLALLGSGLTSRLIKLGDRSSGV